MFPASAIYTPSLLWRCSVFLVVFFAIFFLSHLPSFVHFISNKQKCLEQSFTCLQINRGSLRFCHVKKMLTFLFSFQMFLSWLNFSLASFPLKVFVCLQTSFSEHGISSSMLGWNKWQNSFYWIVMLLTWWQNKDHKIIQRVVTLCWTTFE